MIRSFPFFLQQDGLVFPNRQKKVLMNTAPGFGI